MKKAILYFICILIVSSVSAAPGLKLMQKFDETFPNAQNVKWMDDKEGYFVSFNQNGNFNKVLYNKSGDFVYSLKYNHGEELPVNIKMMLSRKFNDAKILGITEVATQSNMIYNIKLVKDKKLYCLDVSSDAVISKQEKFNYSAD